MSKRSVFTTITPLPAGVSRETAVQFLQNHLEMIDLNPLVKERHPIKAPPHASPEEFHCVWYSLTDKIAYLPGGLATGDVSYTCAFHDLPNGLQTHCYAPMGLEIRDKWTVNGSLPGEPVQPVELGIGAPITGLYIREDVDMRCNMLMTGFVKKTLKKAHACLIDRLKVKAQIVTAAEINASIASGPTPPPGSSGAGSHNSWLPPPPGSPDPRLASPGYGYAQPVPPGSPHGSEFAVPTNHPHQQQQQQGGSPDMTLRHAPTVGRDATGRVSWQALKANPSVSSRHSSSTSGGGHGGVSLEDNPLPPLPVQHTGSSYCVPTQTPPPPPGYSYDGKPLPMNPHGGYPQQPQLGQYPPQQQMGQYPPPQQQQQHMGHYPPSHLHPQQQQQQQQQYGPPLGGYQGYPQHPQQQIVGQQQPVAGGHSAELMGSEHTAKEKKGFVAELE